MKNRTMIVAGTVLLMMVLAGCAQATATPAPLVVTLPPANESSGAATDAATQAPAASGAAKIFTLTNESEARFIVNEILNGAPNRVVGKTNAVQGSITMDLSNPAATSMSDVRVDMSQLATDNPMRTRTMQGSILQTGDPANQFAVFSAKKFDGLPATVKVGETYTFTITGDLTLHGTTKPETFEASAKAVSDTRLEGLASLKNIQYADFGIAILRLPFQVASVDNIVTLEIAFVAEVK